MQDFFEFFHCRELSLKRWSFVTWRWVQILWINLRKSFLILISGWSIESNMQRLTLSMSDEWIPIPNTYTSDLIVYKFPKKYLPAYCVHKIYICIHISLSLSLSVSFHLYVMCLIFSISLCILCCMSMYVNQDEEAKIEEKAERVESRRSSTASTADKSESRRQSIAEKIAKKVCSHLHFDSRFHQNLYS